MVNNTPIIIISIIFVAFAIFAFIDAQCVELSVASIIVAIVFLHSAMKFHMILKIIKSH